MCTIFTESSCLMLHDALWHFWVKQKNLHLLSDRYYYIHSSRRNPSFRTSTWLSDKREKWYSTQKWESGSSSISSNSFAALESTFSSNFTRNLRANYQLLVTVSALWLDLDNIFQHMLITEKWIPLDEVYMRWSYLTYSYKI